VTGHLIGWFVVCVCAITVAYLSFLATPRWGRLRYLVVGLLLAWSLTPFRFDGEHWAPAFAVAIFRLFLEEGANPRGPVYLLGAVTAGVLALHLLIGLVTGVLGRLRKDAPPKA